MPKTSVSRGFLQLRGFFSSMRHQSGEFCKKKSYIVLQKFRELMHKLRELFAKIERFSQKIRRVKGGPRPWERSSVGLFVLFLSTVGLFPPDNGRPYTICAAQDYIFVSVRSVIFCWGDCFAVIEISSKRFRRPGNIGTT